MNFDMYSPQLMKQSLVSAYNGLALGGIVMDYGYQYVPPKPIDDNPFHLLNKQYYYFDKYSQMDQSSFVQGKVKYFNEKIGEYEQEIANLSLPDSVFQKAEYINYIKDIYKKSDGNVRDDIRINSRMGKYDISPDVVMNNGSSSSTNGSSSSNNGLSTNPLISQTSTLTSILRVIAMGVAYQRNKSLLRAFGASLVPAPYLVYVGYDAYVKKNKN